MINTITAESVIYTHYSSDWEWDYFEAEWNFRLGLQSQHYCLELSDIRNWERTRLLLRALQLPLTSLASPVTHHSDRIDWLTLDLAPIQEQYQQQGKLVFNNVDVNGCYLILVGAFYYKVFESKLSFSNGEQQTEIKIDVQELLDDGMVEHFEELDEEGGFDEFLAEIEVFAIRQILD